MANADREAVAALCVHIFDKLSQYPRKEEQLLALAVGFILMCRAYDVRPQEVFTVANNVMYDRVHSERMKAQFAALAYYLDTEFKNGG